MVGHAATTAAMLQNALLFPLLSSLLLFDSRATQVSSRAGSRRGTPLNVELSPHVTGFGTRSVFSMGVALDNSRTLQVLVDTGSSSLVVQSGVGGNTPLQATSFLAHSLAGVRSGQNASIEYEGARVTGSVLHSTVCLPGDRDSNGGILPTGKTCVKSFPVFESATQDSGFSSLGLDGIMGLGPVPGKTKLGINELDETFVDGLAQSSIQDRRIFSLFTSPGPAYGPSMLTLGGWSPANIRADSELHFWSLPQPLTGRWDLRLQDVLLVFANGSADVSLGPCGAGAGGDCRALLDSGTALLEATPAITEAISSRVVDDAGQCLEQAQMPDLHIKLSNADVFKLGPEDYMQNLKACELGVEDIHAKLASSSSSEPKATLVLGQPFMRKFYAVFDQESSRIGLAVSVASSPSTQNEERHQRQLRQQQETLASFLKGAAS
mmetsp:Transcript_8449/g.15913  ORF Transcript_8449/g.15913 Transcript_8449/m.15913 type:complete len:437 (-) Transcript_8449:119-1429(-)